MKALYCILIFSGLSANAQNCAQWDQDGSPGVTFNDMALVIDSWPDSIQTTNFVEIVNCFIYPQRHALDWGSYLGTLEQRPALIAGLDLPNKKEPRTTWPLAKGGGGSGGAGDSTCASDVKVRGTLIVPHNSSNGLPADDFHFYMYQNDRPSVEVLGASASNSTFGTVDVALNSNDNHGTPPGNMPPFHGAQVDMSDGTVPDGGVLKIDVMLCMNEKNCLKIGDYEWTYDQQGQPPQPMGGKNGWRIQPPHPGGNGGNVGDPGGGGQGAQEGNGGGDGNHIHWICIENDDTEQLLVNEVKVLASDFNYPSLDAIDWDAIDPYKTLDNKPPVVIAPGDKWCFPFHTTGSYLNGHVYVWYDAVPQPIAKRKGGNPGQPAMVFGDHPNPELSLDADSDGLWDSFEETFGLDYTDDGTTDPNQGAMGDPDLDTLSNATEQELLTDPFNANDPPQIPVGENAFNTDPSTPNFVAFGTLPAPPIPAGFFGPGSDPFTGTVELLPDNPFDLCEAIGAGNAVLSRPQSIPLPLCGDAAPVSIELVELSLVSAAPITVNYSGVPTEMWDVQLTLGTNASLGVLNVTKLHGNGGTCDIGIQLRPQFIFTKVGTGDTLILEGPTTGYDNIPLLATGLPWSHVPFGFDCPGCMGPFMPGFGPDGLQPFTLASPFMGLTLTPNCPLPPPGTGDLVPGYSFIETKTFELVIGGNEPPIPADFFGPGSLPFEGPIRFQGDPSGITPPCSGDPGQTDTLIERLGPAHLDDPPSTVQVPIEMVQLSLQSVQPITVDGSGLWNVHLGLEPSEINAGSMTITRSNSSGGTFSAFVNLHPVLTFEKADGTGMPLVFPLVQPCTPFQLPETPWVYDNGQLFWPSCGANFIPGVTPSP